jgi:hypothetical protein
MLLREPRLCQLVVQKEHHPDTLEFGRNPASFAISGMAELPHRPRNRTPAARARVQRRPVQAPIAAFPPP